MYATPMDPSLQVTLAPSAPDPKPSCRKCYGRGHVGRNIRTGKHVPCACVSKQLRTK